MKLWNLTYLKYFYDAAMLSSVDKAAKKNFVTQSAVSQSIRKLGDLLGAPLLHHQRRRFDLTDEGRMLFERCKTIFASVEELEELFTDTLKTLQGDLVIATSQTLAVDFLAEKLGQFKKAHPGVQPKLKLGKSLLVKQWVAEGTADFGIIVEKGEKATVRSLKISEGNFVLISTKKSGDAAAESFVVTEERHEVEQLRGFYRKKFKSELPVLMVVESWNVISSLVGAGLGVGLVPDFAARRNTKTKVVDLGFPKIKYEISVVVRAGVAPSRKVKAFLDLLG